MDEKRAYKRWCPTCQQPMQKRGKTAAGTQRWLCLPCSRSHSLGHETQASGRLLDRFVAWLLGKQSQAELSGVTERTWRAQTIWCWEIAPPYEPTGEVYQVIVIDGIRVGSLVCLIARTPEHVIAWHWAPYESSGTWSELFDRTPAPGFVVCDGQKGMLLGLKRSWPTTVIQRCHFHVWQNVRTKLTLHPQTEAGQDLLRLTRGLWQVYRPEDMAAWQIRFKQWETKHGAFVKQRTYAQRLKDNKRQWWYTHGRLRSAYRQLRKLQEDGQLFTYIHFPDACIPRNTNHMEGGINSQLRTKLKLHRGMSEEHQRRLVEWYLYTRTESPKPPRNCL
ncbi:MAG: IS1249 family transposase [Candidatus Saccharimonadales bacterium]